MSIEPQLTVAGVQRGFWHTEVMRKLFLHGLGMQLERDAVLHCTHVHRMPAWFLATGLYHNKMPPSSILLLPSKNFCRQLYFKLSNFRHYCHHEYGFREENLHWRQDLKKRKALTSNFQGLLQAYNKYISRWKKGKNKHRCTQMDWQKLQNPVEENH